jgi:hypothetical protein
MSINKRITGGKRLRHHKLFGSLETPPLGWAGEDRGFKFSLQDYRAEVDAKVKSGMKPALAHREVGRHYGPQAWNWLDTFYTKSVLVPHGIAISPPMSGDHEFRFNSKHNKFIAGWWYDRYASKLGPTNTIAAWVATKVGYISEGQPHVHRKFEALPVAQLEMGEQAQSYEDTTYFLEPPRCIGINPYTDFLYIGEFTRPIKEYPDYAVRVEEEILKRFLKFHGVKR